MNTFRFSHCPYCRQDRMTFVGVLGYRDRVKFGSLMIELAEAPELFRCNGCGTLMTMNAIPPEEALDLYRRSSSGERWTTEKFGNIADRSTLQALSGALMPGKRVLDIGSGASDFLTFARDRGCRTFAFEPSRESAEIQRERGHEIVASLDGPAAAFDLITLFDVVEHLYDPRAMFASLRRLLAQGGRIAVLTGAPQSLPARFTGAKWWYVQYPEHVCVPTLKALRHLPGLAVIKKVATFAKAGYRLPVREAWSIARNRYRAGEYDGLPSVVSDHQLVFLKEVNA
ncbi:class I SAM-dependent methyltransferase [Pelagibius sp. CAU 1746]|uniref:class I SAM-dependent methyltransferase n=1 Tax=Pelagibius sp. CAU 1746 TaxID=3140370 RepID=UPI00325AF116